MSVNNKVPLGSPEKFRYGLWPGRPRKSHNRFIHPLFLNSAQSACLREKAKRPPVISCD